MDRSQREDFCRRVFERLAMAVARDTPLGIGTWPKAWEATHPYGEKVIRAADAFVAGQPGVTKEHVIDAGRDYVEAWRRVADQYKEATQRRKNGKS